MVVWLPPSAVNDNAVAGFARVVGPINPTHAAENFGTTQLASPGTVDVNGITRLQYQVDDLGFPLTDISSQVVLQYEAGDVTGTNMTASAFIAPATAFGAGVVPTPAQIIAASTIVLRGGSSRTTAGSLNLALFTNINVWSPNVKYWFLATPTYVVDMMSTPSIANDIPIGDVNVNGRAVSIWTNRTPEAPVILSPQESSVVFPGTEVDLVFSPKDPDRVGTFPTDIGPADFDDMAGVQIQYAAQPTATEPNPVWADLPIADTTGTTFQRGWFMDRSATEPANDGAKVFWETRQIKIRCGISALAASAANLPSGAWQIRVRTFDYGHAYPGTNGITFSKPPLNDGAFAYTPSNYPAVNTSPWSMPVGFFIAPQVPKPLPVSPKENRAVVEGAVVTLVWQYRNTYSPPFAQAKRTVQIRRVGGASWTNLVLDESSSNQSLPVSGYNFVSGNQYEWRVRVTDTSGSMSEYSDPARFWVVPAPASGDVIPDPGSTIDGATLGCGTHRIVIFRRGGTERVGEIRKVSYVEWNRVRDDISTAKVVVSGWDVDCGNLLAKLQTWAYEVAIFRDNGYGSERVWEGPITLLTYEVDSVTIHAKDVMAYAYRRIIKQQMSDFGNSPTAGDTVTSRAARILHDAFAPDDPNVLAYLQVLARPDDAVQYRSTPAYSRTVFEEVDDMAANAGLDYAAVGRAILLWGTKHRIGTLPEFRDKDLGSSPIVSEYGMSMANVYAVSDGNGVYGEATRLDENGEDPVYGLVEMLSSTWASESTDETGTYTEAGLETIRQSFAESSERSIAARYPPPVVVRVPDNTRLNPDTVLSIQHLVPGVVVPLRSTGTLRTVVASQKLDAVKVTETAGEETITITLSPFSRDDIQPEGEVE